MPTEKAAPRVMWFDDAAARDVRTVGGKNAALATMIQDLTAKGIRVPRGFMVTAEAYREFLREHDLKPRIRRILATLDKTSLKDLALRGEEIRHLILKSTLSPELMEDIREAYHMLCREVKVEQLDVAVRSSATAEDLPEASFAGQQESFLNVRGDKELAEAVLRCFASLYTDRAISYRIDHGFTDLDIAISVGVQQMIRSDLATSGVMFTLDTESGFRDVVLINASYGLGEAIVQGAVNPDEYIVFKPTLGQSPRPILKKKCGQKAVKVLYDSDTRHGTKTVATLPLDQERFALNEDEILGLAVWGKLIEEHFSDLYGRPTPMDIEWAKDGISGDFYILQARPETVHRLESASGQRDAQGTVTATQSLSEALVYSLPSKSRVLLEGVAVGEKIAAGKACIVHEVKDLSRLKPGDILVSEKTDPDWEPSMRIASGIVTNRGGRTCHAAIVSRELGLPAIVGTKTGTNDLKDGQEVTLSCAEGEVGRVYDGLLPIETSRIELTDTAAPLTSVMLNVAHPEQAFRIAKIPNDGVGLARIEFIITHYIKVHPMALLADPKDLPSDVNQAIDALVARYPSRPAYFVDQLAEGVGMIAAAFYPKPVIVRFSDFKSDEYAHLLGGERYEPREANPMLGFRGASRYYNPAYRLGFGLECQAIAKVRQEMGLANVAVMVPFCRTVDEGRKVLDEMAQHGLRRGKDGLLVYVMCEIPANVILADQFAEIFDGFSIGSNDLTQLTLGIDRDSEFLASLFDERNEAVTSLISSVIKTAHKHDIPVGLCGQAPSDDPEFAAFLVHQGIDSISLSPDVAAKMRQRILLIEHARDKEQREVLEHPALIKGHHRPHGGWHRWRTTQKYSGSPRSEV